MIHTNKTFYCVDETKTFQCMFQVETGQLSIGLARNGSISIVLSEEERIALSKALWYSVQKG